MKPHKLLLTSLLAAAAMSAVPAWADSTWAALDENGNPQTTGFTTISKNNPTSIDADSIATFTAKTDVNTNGHSLQIKIKDKNSEITLGDITGGGAVWIKSGYWQATATAFSGAGDLYFLGESHVQFGKAAKFDLNNNVFLGASTKIVQGDGLSNTAFRVGVWDSANRTVNFKGTTTVLSGGTTISFRNSGILNISTLAGSGNLNTSSYNNAGANKLNISGASNFTGKITLNSAVELNWSADSTFGGLSGNGAVAAGSKLNIAKAGSDSTSFSGTVGSSTSGVALALSGTGSQSFTGTNYFSTVSVGADATLDLSGGTVTLGDAIQNSGIVTVSAGTVFNLTQVGANTLISNINSGSIFGWNLLGIGNFTYNGATITVGRGLTSSGEGVVNYDDSAEAKVLTWDGGPFGTWKDAGISENPEKPWTSNDGAEAFYRGDSVTFGTENAEVTVSGTVIPSAMTISANTSFTGTGRIEAVSSSLTFNNDAALTLGDNVTLALGGTNGAGLAGYASANIAGTGTLELNLSQAWGNTLNISNASFTGTTYLTNGWFTINGAAIGNTLKLADEVNFQVNANTSVTFSKNLEIEGTTLTHQNTQGGDSHLTFDGTVTGAGTYVRQGGGGNLNFNNTVNLGGFNGKTGTSIFNSQTTLGALTVSGGTTTFASTSTANITTVTQSGGATNFNGTTTTIGTLNVTGGTATFTTDASVNKITGAGAGTIKIESGTVTMASSGTQADQNMLASSLEIGGVFDGNGGYKAAKLTGGFTDQFKRDATNQTIAVNGGGELQIGTADRGARWEIGSDTSISLSNGGVISGLGDSYGALDFNSANTVRAEGTGNTISAAVRLRSGAVTFNVSENFDLTISGTLQKMTSGSTNTTDNASGTLSKSGSGKLVLSGDNSKYGRAINVTEGTLVAAHAKALGTGTVTVSNGATLGVKVASAVTAGTVTFNAGSKFLIDLTSVSVVEDAALTIIASSAISFNSTPTDSLTSDIIESYFDADNSVLGDYSTWLRDWSYNTTNGRLQLTLTIPEPSTFGLLAGLGALALAGTRRRRKKA